MSVGDWTRPSTSERRRSPSCISATSAPLYHKTPLESPGTTCKHDTACARGPWHLHASAPKTGYMQMVLQAAHMTAYYIEYGRIHFGGTEWNSKRVPGFSVQALYNRREGRPTYQSIESATTKPQPNRVSSVCIMSARGRVQ